MGTLILDPHVEDGPVFRREVEGTTLIVSPHGPLGNFQEDEIVRESTALAELIDRLGPHGLVVDMQHSDYIGSIMVGAIIRLGKRMAFRGGRMALCNVTPAVSEILRSTRLPAGWPLYVTRADALSAVAGDSDAKGSKPLPR